MPIPNPDCYEEMKETYNPTEPENPVNDSDEFFMGAKTAATLMKPR